MANDLAKLNRLRVNAGKPELKSWKASQAKLDAAVKVLTDAGHLDVLPGANTEAKAETPDPVVAAARQEPDAPPSLSESALSKNISTPAKPEEKATTHVKAHLARGLDTDGYARHSRERVRDLREAEKRAKKKVKLSDEDKKQIKDEAEARGKVDPKKDPVKAARQQKHIADKKAARQATGKTTAKQVNANETTVADIARDLGIDPKVARAKLRRHEDKLTKLHTKGQDRWTFPKTAASDIKKILQGAK